MATLSRALIAETPQMYKIYSEKEFTFNGIKQYNRNSLLWDKSLNVDGIQLIKMFNFFTVDNLSTSFLNGISYLEE